MRMQVVRTHRGGKFHRPDDDGEPACGSESEDDGDVWHPIIDPDEHGEDHLCQMPACFGEPHSPVGRTGRDIPRELADLDPDDLPA